jgi:hypothetical protein
MPVNECPSGAKPRVTAGSFSILESLATEGPDVIHLENKTRIFFIESEAEVHGYTQQFHQLTAMALSPADSLDLIKNAIPNPRRGRQRRRPRR